jgi:hypothetical protein
VLDRGQHGAELIVDARGNRMTPRNRYRLRCDADVRARSNYLGAAINLELQLPNMKWLVGRQCDLGDVLADLATRIHAVSDSPRLDKFADTLAALRAPQ